MEPWISPEHNIHAFPANEHCTCICLQRVLPMGAALASNCFFNILAPKCSTATYTCTHKQSQRSVNTRCDIPGLRAVHATFHQIKHLVENLWTVECSPSGEPLNSRMFFLWEQRNCSSHSLYLLRVMNDELTHSSRARLQEGYSSSLSPLIQQTSVMRLSFFFFFPSSLSYKRLPVSYHLRHL